MRKFLLFVAFILCLYTTSSSQSLDSALSKYAWDYQPEKVYLHYDKSSYYAGETIWFKAYLLEGLLPALKSKTLYVDWIAPNGIVLSHTVSPIVDASTNGQFEVPTDFKGEFIHVRAYTRWMMNFDTAFVYSKNIPVISRDSVKTKTPVVIKTSLELFPEGGEIISGVQNRIAFKARDQFGRPATIKGKLTDEEGKVLETFSSVHDGMGSFLLTPKEGSSYSVKWINEKNIQHSTSLPEIKPSGISMQVNTEGEKRIVYLHSEKDISPHLKQLHLIGTLNQAMVFKNKISMEESNSVRRVIPTASLPSGILTITLFDANWNAIAERITFINNKEYLFEPVMEVQRWGLGKRKRNEIEIKLPDSIAEADLSISVTDAAIEKDTSDNIISHFLLSSDIRGKVYNAAYYFSNNSPSVQQHLDLVMLTHGWRRFNWDDVAKGRMPKIDYPKDTSYLTLSGKVFGVAKNQLTGKESIVLLAKEDTVTKMLVMAINTDGSFSDPDIILFDTLKVYYSLKSKFLGLAEARFMTELLPAPSYVTFSKSFVNAKNIFDTAAMYYHTRLASKALEILWIQKGKTLAPVIVKTTKKSPAQVLEEKYASGLFQGGDGYQFDLVNDAASLGALNILTYLQGRVAGLQINPNSIPPSLSWRGSTPQVFLDELPVDAAMALNIPVSDIAFVKVIRPPFVGAVGGGGGGAIAIYTRKGNDRLPAGKGLSSNLITGYTPVREFYSPNYDRFDPRNDNLDIRTTLYWDPLLSTKRKGNSIKLSFYNNDVTKSFRVVIEGVSKDGFFTHYEQIME